MLFNPGIRVLCAVLTLGMLAGARPASAQEYPQRPVRLIVPFTAGGGTDVLGRILAKNLSMLLAQPVIVENVAGASGTVGTAQAARAAADGYTLLLGASVTNAIAPALYPQLRYEPVSDFVPIAQLATFGNPIVVNPALPVRTIADLTAWARQAKNGGSYGTWGVGSAGHLAMEMVNAKTGAALTHIPYKGAVLALNDVLSGQLPVAVTDPLVVLPFYKAGKVKVIAVTGARRSASMPEVPTLAEQGVALSTDSWYAVFAPAKTPASVQQKLQVAMHQVMATAEFQKTLGDLGLQPSTLSTAEFDSVRRQDLATWSRLVVLSGAKAD
jgi:tripartite-type tricarboxylate transporter receptor subunit TctC